jgi:multidrug efflux pump subunit AcrB
MHEALKPLGFAVGLSIVLIFLTLVFQFGDIVSSLLVLVAVPLGFIGVLVSLWAFKSTLSLNSVLGVILLNGIAVANSIILVDFLKRLVDRGVSPEDAAVEAGRKRLRPILITSMTTILGMLPIALGMGDGGRILQPLGIAVSGGLWVSMGLTLFVVPALQVAWLRRRSARMVVKVPVTSELPGLQKAEHGIAEVGPEVGIQGSAGAQDTGV